ncbi:hypothetical protein [Escherichia coli]|uniref:hypothetical protein n=1 Tax=Escherichia coli TaxID=562 RepID=UPI0038B27861
MKSYHKAALLILSWIMLVTALPVHAESMTNPERVRAEVVAETFVLKCTPQENATDSKPFFVQLDDHKGAQGWERVATWDNNIKIPLDMNSSIPNDNGKLETVYMFGKSDSEGMLTGPTLMISYVRATNETTYGEVINVKDDVNQGPHGRGVCVQTDHQSNEG